jgi:tRNA (guanosine-2'-O-)-methyltransferase
MRSARLVPFGFLAIALVTAGCVVRTRATVDTTPVRARVEVTPPPPPPAQVTVSAQLPPAGVSVVEVQCSPGAVEACNGLDDNCDGRIDEGCGWASGQIQITLAWNTGADIDLYVTDPFGETISYQRRQSASGGVLDHDARGACVGRGDTIENVYWSSPTPPRGTYQVEVHYWGDCGVAGPTPVQVAIAVGGRVIGVYHLTLYNQQRVPVVAFSL